MNAQQAADAVKALPYPKSGDYDTKEEWQAARRAYQESWGKVTQEFAEYLAATYAPWLVKQTQDMIWRKAWEDGHSSGYSEVENYYMDLASFAEDAVTQNRE